MKNTCRNLCSKLFPLKEDYLNQISSDAKEELLIYTESQQEKEFHLKVFEIIMENLFDFEVIGLHVLKQDFYLKIKKAFRENLEMNMTPQDKMISSITMHSLNIKWYMDNILKEKFVQNMMHIDHILLLGNSFNIFNSNCFFKQLLIIYDIQNI